MYETLDVRREDSLLWVTLNRPQRLNALNTRMIEELGALLDGLPEDREARVVILRGAGKAFCSGWDLKDESAEGSLTGSVDVALRLQRRFSNVILRMRRVPQPIVACVHGAATGGGFSVALGADVRIAGESARMNCAYIRVGPRRLRRGLELLPAAHRRRLERRRADPHRQLHRRRARGADRARVPRRSRRGARIRGVARSRRTSCATLRSACASPRNA